MSQGLDVSNVVNVTVNLAPQAAQFANFDSLLIVGDSNVIDTVQRIRSYTGLASVASDFGTTAPEYLAAQNFFSQLPAPTQLYIGRWAQSATHGALQGGTLTASQQQLANFTAVTNGGVDFVIDGTNVNLTGLDFHLQTNLNGVASVITTALSTHGSCIWNGTNFEVISATTGTSSSVAFATAGAGTDISVLLGLTSTFGGYVVPGLAAETALAAVALLDNLKTQWYGLQFASTHIVDADHLAIAGYIEATTHLYGVTTQDAGALSSVATNDIGYELQQLRYNRTFYQYSSSSPYACASMFGREFTVDFNGNNTVITLAFKQEPGVQPESLTQTQYEALTAKNYNFFARFNNNTAIIVNNTVASGLYIDMIHDLDWFANALQTNLYNRLYQSTTKLPQTDPGVHQLVTVAEGTCQAAVTNGTAAPGTWTQEGFGTLSYGDYMPSGYYVYAPPISQQSPADRAARKSPTLQIAIKLAGAIQSVDAIVNVNQ